MDYQLEIDKLVKDVQDAQDPLAGSVAAAELQRAMRAATSRLAELRALHMRLAVTNGWTYEEIAEAHGITRARVEQIVNR